MLDTSIVRADFAASPVLSPLRLGFAPIARSGPRIRRLAIPLPQVTRLIRYARSALAIVAPRRPVAERVILLGGRRFVVLAARRAYGRQVPRSPDLIRLALGSGAGLQLRAIGRLAVVAIELPFASETAS